MVTPCPQVCGTLCVLAGPLAPCGAVNGTDVYNTVPSTGSRAGHPHLRNHTVPKLPACSLCRHRGGGAVRVEDVHGKEAVKGSDERGYGTVLEGRRVGGQ